MKLIVLASRSLEAIKKRVFGKNKQVQSAYFLNILLHFGDRLSSILLLVVFIRHSSNQDFASYSEILVLIGGIALLCDFGTGMILPVQVKKGLGIFPIYALRGIFLAISIAFIWIIKISFIEKIFLFTGVLELICRSPQFFMEFISYRRILQCSIFVKQFFVLLVVYGLGFKGNIGYENCLIILSTGSILSSVICLYPIKKEINKFNISIKELYVLLKSGFIVCLAQILYFLRGGLPIIVISSYDLSIAKEFRAIGTFQSLSQQVTFIICGAFYSFIVSRNLGAMKFFSELIKLSILIIVFIFLFSIASLNYDLFNIIFSIKFRDILVNFYIGMASMITIPLSLGIITYLNSKDQAKKLLYISILAVFIEAIFVVIYCTGLNPHIIFLSMCAFDITIIVTGIYFNREIFNYIKRYLKSAI